MPHIHFQPGLMPSISTIPTYFERLMTVSVFDTGSHVVSGTTSTMTFVDGVLTYDIEGEGLTLATVNGEETLVGGTITKLVATLSGSQTSVVMKSLDFSVSNLAHAVATDIATPSAGATSPSRAASRWQVSTPMQEKRD